MSLRFDHCAGNQFELLSDGEQVGSAILEAIDRAQHFILIELYMVESGRFAERLFDAVRAAAERGVDTFLLLDHFGSLGLPTGLVGRLLHPRVRLVWFNPIQVRKLLKNFHRDHRKMVVVDQNVAFVGGFCIVDEFWPTQETSPQLSDEQPWLDVAVRIEGPIVVDWCELFRRVWKRVTQAPLDLPSMPVPQSGSMIGRVAWSSGHLYQGILREFSTRARKARQRIFIASPYFVPSWRIRRRLIKAAKRGVDVRLLLPGPKTDHPGVRFASWRYYKKMLNHGIRIYEFQPRFIHAKVILCDDWTSVGSCNLDHWNQRWNLEANQEVLSKEFAGQVVEFFESCFAESEEQDLKKWLKPYWRRRLLAYFWGQVDSWLTRL